MHNADFFGDQRLFFCNFSIFSIYTMNMKNNLEKEIGWLLQEKYNGKATKKFRKDVARLKKGEPLDYIIGFVDFLDCKIDLSKRPLIPRPETEWWTQEAMERLPKDKPLKVLDMFSGSGCIGVYIMRHVKNAHVTFADSEKNTIEQIEINCKINKFLKTRYQIIQSYIFENITGTFDYIFANPPYIPIAKKDGLQESVLKYEPHVALFGDKGGTFYIKQFLSQARNFLNPRGQIFMEFDSFQKPVIEKMLKKFGYQSWQFHKDQYKKWRWVSVGRPYTWL